AAPKAASSLEAGDVEPSMVEKIIVTAQKREEAAQDVPITLTAFSGRAAETYRLESLRDISRLTPGLLVSSFSYSSPTIAIRGATNTFTQIGANKPVAVVLDDLFIPRNSAATFDLYGLNSVQVLKGPQGTLFGRNVTGGAIILDTGKPS
ncbi:TonB-dependent receptor plug domain-containing protein, partial [Streptomyces sp. 4F14]